MSARAAQLYLRARQHPQVAAIYGSSEVWHEVPFSTADGGTIVRGTIDCLARTGPDQVTVLEFKTGRPRDWHEAQLRLYQRAVERLFPGGQVRAELCTSARRQDSRQSPPGAYAQNPQSVAFCEGFR